MPLTPDTRLGPYEIAAQIGAGGMGEVYRATDTKLKRQVAIKVLPESLAADAERLARFQREAEVLASLNHPNIAQIHGLEQSGGTIALVMELVEGEDLSQRIARGAVPIDEALPIAKQIAEALEAAHEQGIIHRDLKPANIKVRPDGTVKVLDFGLAKAMGPAEAGHYVRGRTGDDRGVADGRSARLQPGLSEAPTITTPAHLRQGYGGQAVTQAGIILGTAAYMSPEQARGKTVDKRADIWAFGAVLYEMLAGRRAFGGEDVTVTLARVVEREPDFEALPPSVPPHVRQALRVCLRKDLKQRVSDIRDVHLALDGAFEAEGTFRTETATPASPAGWRRALIPAATLIIGGAVVGGAVWLATRPTLPSVSRLQIAPTGEAALTINGVERDVAITPDGSRVIYVGNRGTQLFVRPLDTLEPTAIFTGSPRGPFVSPDGQWVAFLDVGNTLKKVAVTGGPPVTLAALDLGTRGASWGPDDAIIFATNNLATGLQSVAAAGGTPTVLTRPDRAQGEEDHVWPELLPGGRAVLFTITTKAGLDQHRVAVLDLATGRRTVLVRGGGHAHYMPSGHLVYAAAGTLRAVPFDLATLEVRGTPVTVIPDVLMTQNGGLDGVMTGGGTLAYVSGGERAQRTMVWVDRQGRETPIPMPPRPYVYPRLSPEGTRVAVWAQDQDSDLWLWDLTRVTLTRLTFEPGMDRGPLWTPDGRRLLFSSDRAGGQNLFVQSADGTGSATQLAESPYQQVPTGITTDGTRVVFHELTQTRQRDLRLLTLNPTPRVGALVETPFEERGGIVSPDGRWLAYESNNSGQFEIYVRPFPNVGDGLWQVSTGGGTQALWAKNGLELFYRTPDGAVLTVPVVPRDSVWGAGMATKLVEGRYFIGGALISRQYDVTSDGQRFLMIKEGGAEQAAASASLIIVLNWQEELKRLVPVD